MSKTILDVQNLEVEFKSDEKTVKAVNNISLQLRRGETLGIVGESGSGKSVTSLAIMGLIQEPGKISGGEILFAPQEDSKQINLLELSTEEIRLYRGGDIAMIFQEPMSSLNPVYTVGYQLTEAITRHQDISLKEAQQKAIASLQEVKLLPSDEDLRSSLIESGVADNDYSLAQAIKYHKESMLERYPHQLSGGQLQRVMIAMAISCNPLLLIADEPTTALDVTVQATIVDLLRELQQQRNMAMIFITHDLGLIAEIADRVVVMYQGRIMEHGSAADIFNDPKHPYTKGLVACRPTLDSHPRKLLTVADYMSVEETPTGEPVITGKQPEIPPQVTTEDIAARLRQLEKEPSLFQVKNLKVGFPVRGVFGGTKRYFMAVNDVSFEVKQGETLGLVGESGCGKTTLGRTLLRLVKPMSGQMIFEGRDITDLSSKALQKLRREMQIIFQNPFSSLNPRMKVGDIVMEPLVIHSQGETKQQRRKRVGSLLERVGLSADAMNRYPHQFSGGQRQRICVARSLALNPKFIICDESVSALDVSVQAQVLNLLKELQSEFNLTYIFISHDLSVVKFISDRILVMNKGEIVERGTAEDIYRNPQKEYTQKLIASIPTGDPKKMRSGLPKTLEELENELLGLVQQDKATFERLIETQKNQTPDESLEWILEKVIHDLTRDRE
ncbi:MAG: ABC transporter ATP-binding protein [Cyanobacteria bacterium P01_A01_bin.45]